MLIIHGDNQVASRSLLLAAKQTATAKNLEIISLSGDELNLAELQNYVNSVNLLGTTNCVVVEGFFGRRPSNEKKKIIEQLEKWSNEQIILWDGKDVSLQLKNFPLNIVKKFELPRTVFKFLDSLALNDLSQTLETTPPEFVFSLLVGQVRKLMIIKSGGGNFPDWQMAKLKSQAAKFTDQELSSMHHQLLDIDFKNKTSASAMDLAQALEVWVATSTS